MEYQLATIKDIFDKVPAERIGACMHELTAMLIQSAALRNMITIAAKAEGIGISEAFSFPEFLTWTDDDTGNIDLTLFCGESGEELLSLHTTLGAES